jgi:twitching motility protein PilI
MTVATEANETTEAVSVSRLGVSIGARHWLIDLSEAGEILPLPDAITPVPSTQNWFQGIANLRGELFGVSDLGLFQGDQPTQLGKDARLVALSGALGVNAAILVTKMMGLQSMDAMTRDESIAAKGWAGKAWLDASGTRWQELSLAALSRDQEFLSVNR